jgi:hypothetical protein
VAVTDFQSKAMALAKQYANKRHLAKQSTIKAGDSVLVCQRKKNKLMSRYNQNPYIVTEVKGSMLLTSRGGHKNIKEAPSSSSFLPKLLPI